MGNPQISRSNPTLGRLTDLFQRLSEASINRYPGRATLKLRSVRIDERAGW
ncbi:MAG: hypothetical protein NW224_25890 [Leptolyngbyaceae cyanobacterium bins.302]|nr:hypothetical protein [Leptolyngbyaceae cyanobacterium bins.302]